MSDGQQMCIDWVDGKGDQSGIIKEVCELREVTDVLLRLIHEELLRAGPLYLSPGNQLVAWIQHAVSYFHWIKQNQGRKTCISWTGEGCCMMSALRGGCQQTQVHASEGFVCRVLHKICVILTRPSCLSEHLFFEIGPPPLSCVMDEWLNCHKSGNQKDPLKGFPSASSDHTS